MLEDKTDRTWARIQKEPLEIHAASDFLRVEEAGGVDIFLGTTRRWTGDRETVDLEYECYGSMALSEMVGLLQAAGERWPVCRACLLHRTGKVPLREISVIVAVSTPHRDDAFAATRFLIDDLKKRVPIWKKERFADGSAHWVEGELPPLGS